MNTKTIIVLLAVLNAGLIGAFLYRKIQPAPPQPAQLKLEEILSIKELHLVKHTYNHQFLIHRKNNPEKAVRAIAQVPVTITAYINLKEIKLVKQRDSVKSVILPRAKLDPPNYEVDKMLVANTRAFQLHIGKDLYPEVGRYVQQILYKSSDSIRNTAIEHRILEQAEAEGKEYIEYVLRTVGRQDIKVTFGDEKKDQKIKILQDVYRASMQGMRSDTTHYNMRHVLVSSL